MSCFQTHKIVFPEQKEKKKKSFLIKAEASVYYSPISDHNAH